MKQFKRILQLIVVPSVNRRKRGPVRMAIANIRLSLAFISAVTAILASTASLAAPTLQNPFTVRVLYDAPAGDPPATDICFAIGIPRSVNINQTVNFDLAFTGPLGGSPVDIFSARQGGASDSSIPAHQICFYFPNTPVQPGETINITMEGDGTSSDPPIAGDSQSAGNYWTFAQNLFEFQYPRLAPPIFGPVGFGIFGVDDMRGDFDAQDLDPFPLGPPSRSSLTFDGASFFITTVPEPSSVWLASIAMVCAALCSRRRRNPVVEKAIAQK